MKSDKKETVLINQTVLTNIHHMNDGIFLKIQKNLHKTLDKRQNMW